MKIYCLIFLVTTLFVEKVYSSATDMTDVAGKAFNQIKFIAKQFQKVNPKMVYAEAMEKTVSGFRNIHKSKVINEKSTV